MLLLLDAPLQRLLRVLVQHRHRRLRDDGPGVGALVHQVHRAPRHLHSMLQRLPVRMQPGEARQQRRVHVQHPAREGAEERRPHQAHEAGEARDAAAERGDGLHQRAVVRHTVGVALVREHAGGHAGQRRPLQRSHAGHVRHHDRDAGRVLRGAAASRSDWRLVPEPETSTATGAALTGRRPSWARRWTPRSGRPPRPARRARRAARARASPPPAERPRPSPAPC